MKFVHSIVIIVSSVLLLGGCVARHQSDGPMLRLEVMPGKHDTRFGVGEQSPKAIASEPTHVNRTARD